jgi:carboxyl-terminal processing protease
MTMHYIILGTVWAAITLSCTGAAAAAFPAGIWRSEGYGWIVEVLPDGTAVQYQTGRVACLAQPAERYLATFEYVKIGFDRATLAAYQLDSVKWVYFTRVKAKPANCLAKELRKSEDPVLNFEVFWDQLAQHQAFLEYRQIDWLATYRAYRTKISPATTSRQLFNLMADMIAPLNDSHVSITWPGHAKRRGGSWPVDGRLDRDFDLSAGRRAPAHADPIVDRYLYYFEQLQPYKTLTQQSYLVPESAREAVEGLVAWGRVSDDIGYLRIDAESASLVQDLPYPEQLATFQKSLDEAFSDLSGSRAIILDLRYNTGGFPGLALEVAGRFADSNLPLYSARAIENDQLAPPFVARLSPARRPGFAGPVAVLQSRVTASAGDVLALAMGKLPQTRSFGEQTHGIFSDQLFKTLPNGWVLSISNEVYRGLDGAILEGNAVKADVVLDDHFASKTLATGRDLGVEAARVYLEAQLTNRRHGPPGPPSAAASASPSMMTVPQ